MQFFDWLTSITWPHKLFPSSPRQADLASNGDVN